MSWDELKRTKEGGKDYLRLKDGQVVFGVFRGDPLTFFSAFKDAKKYDKWAEGRSFRFHINFVQIEEGDKLSIKVFQGGSRIAAQLSDVREEYGLDCLYKIKRTGSGKDDTQYSILFQSKLTPEQLAKIKKLTLIELGGVDEPLKRQGTEDSNDLPF